MSDHPLIEALKKLETGLGDEAANHIATLEKRVKQLGRTKAAEQIESLQRENEELKRYVNEAERLFRMYGLSSPPRKGHEWPNTGGMGDE